MAKNFVIIYADDLGFGDLACYGASGIPTPNLDRMAAEGLRFTNSYATAATCTPSRYSLLTGSYPWRNPGAKILAGDAPMIITEDEPTLPRILARAGYRSAVVGKWHIGLGEGAIDWNADIRPTPLDVGFDESFIMAATNDRVPCVYVDGRRVANLDPSDPLEVRYAKENPFSEVPTGRTHPELLTTWHSDSQHWDAIVNGVGRIGFCRGGKSAQWDDETMAEVFLERAKGFISRSKEQPFFLYYALHQPHVPRIPSPRFRGATALGPRGDVIAELDWCVGQLLEHLRAEGLDEDTLVIFSSDNGPILDDGYADQARELCGCHRPSGPLRGGKYSVFDGGARVPMILRAPGLAPAGQESAALFSHADLPTSLAVLAGIAPEQAACVDGVDMSAVLTGQDEVGRESLVTEGIGARTVLRHGTWIYIPPHPGPARFADKDTESGFSPEPQLYDLTTDIGQRENLASYCPARVQSLAEELAAIQADTHHAYPHS
ncbi:sulfatase family protein [Ruficoccus amylovorans]|nr:arylsulfatase [Ruficoccus amylovorans]